MDSGACGGVKSSGLQALVVFRPVHPQWRSPAMGNQAQDVEVGMRISARQREALQLVREGRVEYGH